MQFTLRPIHFGRRIKLLGERDIQGLEIVVSRSPGRTEELNLCLDYKEL